MSHYHYLPNIWSPLESFFLAHPQYYELAGACLFELFYGQGPLKKPERHFIAAMTAGSSDCDFLVDLHQREFEREGGDPQWLKGLASVNDNRFQALDLLVTFLSHQPWLVNAEVLQSLCKDADGIVWSLNQLVHAAAIIATTNSLCVLVLGVGDIHPVSVSSHELDNLALRCEWLARDKQQQAGGRGTQEVAYLLERMALLRKAARAQEEAGNEDGHEHKRMTNFVQLTHESNVTDENAAVVNAVTANANMFSLQRPLSYVDFAQRVDSSKTFKIHEFSWDHGYSLIEDVYPALAKTLDHKFQATQSLTYNTMGDFTDVDTSEYRLAIWNYIHALFGIRHDDYDYAQVNEMLSRSMKTFIKTTTCFPARMSPSLRSSVMPDFAVSEKLHVMFLAVEARAQASLLYFTRALTNYYVASKQRKR